MARQLFTNNAVGTLAGSITDVQTTFSLQSGEGALFPTITGGDWFYVTLTKLVVGVPVREIVRVTGRTGDVFTVVRGQDNTTAVAFTAADVVDLRVTAVGMETMLQAEDADIYDTHLANTANPHAVTKTQVGLGNVDNTSDVNKPVSTAQAAADTAVIASSLQTANYLQEIEDAGTGAQATARENLGIAEYEITSAIPLSGDFTVGDIILARKGEMVIISGGAYAHSSATSAVSAAGVVPSQFRPSAVARNTFSNIGSDQTVTVSTSGQITINYSSAQLAGDGMTISYLA